MRYAILSDIHANEAALNAVLTDARDMGAERIVCLGDVVGYGPDCVATLERVYRDVHICLAGNHDDAACGRCTLADFTDFAAEALLKQRKLLSPQALNWLRVLPYVYHGSGFACAHGDFAHPEHFDYILEPEEALPSWSATNEPLLFVGHTHESGIFVLGKSGRPHFLEPRDFELEAGKRYIVNVGSVGYPRKGMCRSSYCIYDDAAKTICFRSLPFDLEGYRIRMHGRGMEEAPWVAARATARRKPAVRTKPPHFGRDTAPENGKARKHFVIALVLFVLAFTVWIMGHPFAKPEGALPQLKTAPELAPRAVTQKPPPPPPTPSPTPSPTAPQFYKVQEKRLTLPPKTTHVRFNVKLESASAPAHVQLIFWAADGSKVATAKAEDYEIKRSIKKRRPVPSAATTAVLAITRARVEDVVIIKSMEFTREGKEL